MQRASLLGVGFLLLLGCGGGTTEDRIIKKLDKLNEATADKVDKAQSVNDLKDIFREYKSQKAAVFSDLKGLGRDKAERFFPRLIDETAAGQKKLHDAVSQLHKRLTGDVTNPVVLIETSSGQVTIELYEKLAPLTVKNFLAYVDDKFFDGTIFHRVMSNFMIQGGGFEPGMKKEKPTRAPILNESFNGVENDRGTIAMARTGEPNSATAQFFINVVDNRALNLSDAQDGVGYAVFGKVVEGMDVVDKIREVKTRRLGPHDDVPAEDVMINSIRRVERKK